MLKARTGFDSRLLTWSRIWMGCSKSDLSGVVALYLPYPSLQRRGVKNPRSDPHDLEKSLSRFQHQSILVLVE